MIKYKENSAGHIAVYLWGRYVGNIVRVAGGYQYRPNKSKQYGEVYATIQQVKNSLEN